MFPLASEIKLLYGHGWRLRREGTVGRNGKWELNPCGGVLEKVVWIDGLPLEEQRVMFAALEVDLEELKSFPLGKAQTFKEGSGGVQ